MRLWCLFCVLSLHLVHSTLDRSCRGCWSGHQRCGWSWNSASCCSCSCRQLRFATTDTFFYCCTNLPLSLDNFVNSAYLYDIWVLCLWFHASLIYINNCPTRCNTKQSIYYSASSRYMFRVSTTPIIRSTQNCNCSIWYWSYILCSYLPPMWPRLCVCLMKF